MKLLTRSLAILALSLFSITAIAEDILRIGIDPNYPPMAFKDAEGELAGMEVDFAKALAAEINHTPDFIEMPFKDLIDALQNDKIDIIMSGLSVTEERREQIHYLPEYLATGQVAIIKKSNASELGAGRSLDKKGVKIGVVEGTTGEAYANGKTNADVLPYPTVEAGLQALQEEKVNYFIHDAPTSWNLESNEQYADLQGLYTPLTEEKLAWAIAKHKVDSLDKKLIRAYEKLKNDGKPKAIASKWLPKTWDLE